MNFKTFAFSTITIAVGFFTQELNARPIFHGPALLFDNSFIGGRGSYEGAELLGETMLGNSGSATELSWVESLISGSLPTLPGSLLEPGGEQAGQTDKTYSVTLPGTWDYAYYMAKWGAGQNVTDHALWLITSGNLLQYQLPNELSHSKIWFHPIQVEGEPNRVPEVVSTLALLAGASLLMVKLHGRKS